ncbi:hypothetical protein [Stenotrophomonas maltophilia]|uniref:hypothetical protein n=1 Tax=Stenotrophomonas maltophilia TaxID=40324 RepID=UPI0015C5467C|nr:hypothetical protein [Stenotrophomonas maltophilia]
MISRKLLCAATLLCLSPFAASAAEAHLTPSSNGGSGAMPSGYTKLFFDIADGDFASELELPANPRNADYVTVTSEASRMARLDAKGTRMESLVYIPVDPLSSITLLKSNVTNSWLVEGYGLSARRVVLKEGLVSQVPVAEKTMTEVNVFGTVSQVRLPALAPAGAVLAVTRYDGEPVTVSGPELANGQEICAEKRSCAYVFDAADGQWHARRGRAHYQPTTAQLPKMDQRWTDIVISGPAEDVETPRYMSLPMDAIEGDVIQMRDLSNSGFYEVGHVVLTSSPKTFQYSSSKGGWIENN